MSVREMVGTIAVAGMAVAACGGSSGGGGDGLGWGDDYSVAGALAELPADLASGGVEILTGDLTAASEAAGLERPEALDDPDGIRGWLLPITGGPADPDDADARPVAFVPLAGVFNPQRIIDIEEFHDELGWSVLDVDSFVEFWRPPARFSVVAGSALDGDVLDGLIDLGDGVMTNRDGEDLAADPTQRSAADDLGRALRLAQDGEQIAVALQTPLAEAWAAGLDETLADDEGLHAVAEALDDAGVFSAYLVRPESGFSSTAVLDEMVRSNRDMEEFREQLEEQFDAASLEPFTTVGIGWAADDDGAVVTIAYRHGSDDAAESNAELLEAVFADGVSLRTNQPISELYDVVGVDADGTVSTVTIRPGEHGHPMTIMSALQARDLPLIHR